MPDLRNPLGPALAPTARPAAQTARSEGVRAAQRAFFEAALAQTASAAPSRPVAAVQPAVAARPAPEQTMRFDANAPRPERPLRPGSLVDIKV